MEKEEGHMTPNMERGARIIIHEWVKVRAWDKVLIVTSKEYLAEAKAMEKEASGKARSVNTLLVENKGRHVGIFLMIMKQFLILIRQLSRRQSIRW